MSTPQPVYEFSAANQYLRFHLKLADPSEYPGWTRVGEAFFAYASEDAVPGLVAVYEYSAADHAGTRYLYSTKPNIGQGWSMRPNPVFWAFPYDKGQDGIAAIYEYHATNPWRFKYSTDPKVGDCWILDRSAFFAIPPEERLVYAFVDIEYDEKPTMSKQPAYDMGGSRRITNTSGAELTEQVEFVKTVVNTFSWGLEETLSVGATLSASFEPPGGSVGAELSVNVELGSHQEWGKSVTEEIKISDTVTVPAGESCVVNSVIDIANDVRTDFTLRFRVTGTSPHGRLSGEDIKKKMIADNRTVGNGSKGKILSVYRDAVLASLPGRFDGAYAVNTLTTLERGSV